MTQVSMLRGTMRLLLVLLLIAMPALAADTNWIPKPDQIARLEKKLVLPPGAALLNKYARYYWAKTAKDGKVIHGSLSMIGGKRGLVIANRPPEGGVMDGGCNVVSVEYNLAKDKVSVWCNGLA